MAIGERLVHKIDYHRMSLTGYHGNVVSLAWVCASVKFVRKPPVAVAKGVTWYVRIKTNRSTLGGPSNICSGARHAVQQKHEGRG